VIPVLAAVASFFLFSPLCQLVASVNMVALPSSSTNPMPHPTPKPTLPKPMHAESARNLLPMKLQGGSELSHSVAGKLMASNVTPVIGICFATITATTLNTLRIRSVLSFNLDLCVMISDICERAFSCESDAVSGKSPFNEKRGCLILDDARATRKTSTRRSHCDLNQSTGRRRSGLV
jgi:hypothetical protein